jgi:hypothetical protein
MRMERREALEAAKLAVRAYVREPSKDATEVEQAWRRVRQLDSVALWRQPPSAVQTTAALPS